MTATRHSQGRSPKVLQIMRPDRGAYSIERVFGDIRAAMGDDLDVTAWVCPHPSRGVLPRLRGALSAAGQSADVFHVTGDAHYLALFLPRARTVLTVHDCEFVRRARGLKRALLWLFWLRLPVARAARVLVPSQAARRDLSALVGIGPDTIEVVENPVSTGFQPQPEARHPGRFRILQVGTKANKNVERLAAALSGLDVELHIVGRPTPAQVAALRAAGVAFTWREGLSDEAIRAAYRDCDALAFCSLSEGFGLPILEAQTVGRPVVTSNRAPMTEVAGDAAVFVDPEDVGSIREAFRRLIDEPALRRALVASGIDNAGRYHPGIAAAAHEKVYRALAGFAQAGQ
jgi:glycosyltransferase involved in cell wall biosynthesis